MAGDEIGRTQKGNNNAYCQDNELSWIDWNLDDEARGLLEFTRMVIAHRFRHPLFRRLTYFRGRAVHEDSEKDITWLHPEGPEMDDEEWAQGHARCLGAHLSGRGLSERDEHGVPVEDDDLMLLLNAHHETIDFRLGDASRPRMGRAHRYVERNRNECGRLVSRRRRLSPAGSHGGAAATLARHVIATYPMPFGAQPTPSGVRFALWAPGAHSVALLLDGPDASRAMAMPARGDGWYELTVTDARAGTRYRYRIDDDLAIPDPAARFAPGDVHGDAEVIDPAAFDWTDDAWTGRPWHETVIYELHVGTFTPEGTYAAVEARLPALKALGITAIELMPLADFPGTRNWGYDGVLLYAPDASYGTPAELKHLVAAAHAQGLMVFLDVVYNHFGPEGNYLHRLAPAFFTDRHATPWGAGLNFDGGDSRTVRDFFVHNALYWLTEFRFDGLRLDAVHAIRDESELHLLNELAHAVASGPGRQRHIHLVLENDRNESRRLARDRERRATTFTAQWNDDFHHVMHHLLTGERHDYYRDYAATPLAHLGRCLAAGLRLPGRGLGASPPAAARRAEPHAPRRCLRELPAEPRPGGQSRLRRAAHRARTGERAARRPSACCCSRRAIPLLFMGEEYGAATPFLFFCDFEPALQEAVRNGRRAEFAEIADRAADASIPDPCVEATRQRSTLDWTSRNAPAHAAWLAMYRELLALRAQHVVPLLPHLTPAAARFEIEGKGALRVEWPADDGRVLVLDLLLPAGRAVALRPLPPTAETLWHYMPEDADAWHVRFHIALPTA